MTTINHLIYFLRKTFTSSYKLAQIWKNSVTTVTALLRQHMCPLLYYFLFVLSTVSGDMCHDILRNFIVRLGRIGGRVLERLSGENNQRMETINSFDAEMDCLFEVSCMNERTIKKQEEAAGLEIGKQEYAHLYDMKGEKTLFCVNCRLYREKSTINDS